MIRIQIRDADLDKTILRPIKTEDNKKRKV